jgi:hypothetical protein
MGIHTDIGHVDDLFVFEFVNKGDRGEQIYGKIGKRILIWIRIRVLMSAPMRIRIHSTFPYVSSGSCQHEHEVFVSN